MPITAETLRISERLRASINRILSSVAKSLTARWAHAWDKVRARLTGAVKTLLYGRDRWPTRKDIGRATHLQQALKAVQASLEDLGKLARRHGTDAMRDAVDAATDAHSELIRSQYPAGSRTKPPSGDRDALTGIVRRADGRIDQLVRPIPVEITRDMVLDLIRGTRLHPDPDITIRRIMSQLEQRFNHGLARALTIVTTEVLDAHRAAAHAARLAARDVLAGWIWTSRCDALTCGSCWVMHGTIHPVDELGPADHPNGRCIAVPKTKTWRELGFDRDDPADELVDGLTLFRALPAEQQRQILGPSRLALLNSGAIDWADLATRRPNPGWRDSYNATPVRDLA